MLTECGDGGIKRHCRNLSGDGVKKMTTASDVANLKEDLESSTWRRRQDFNATPLYGNRISDHVMLKVSPWIGVVRFRKKGKLAPRYVGPFEITERIGPIPLEEIQVDAKLNFVKEPIEILEREIKKLKRSRIPIIKVRWNSKRGPEFTWEREDQMKLKYPHLFSSSTS
ncbi:hypothetical protein Tco_0665353 [Tanacetum coccineum]